jgi:putative acetyltransferase
MQLAVFDDRPMSPLPFVVLIREEQPGDAAAIRSITLAAFEGKPYSEQTEAAIVDALRAAGAMSVSLVAEDAGEIVGHVAFSPIDIDGTPAGGFFGVGPVSVRPDRQGKGIGSALMRAGIDRLKAAGAKGCVLEGDPAYYRRFGFELARRLRYSEGSAEYFQVLELASAEPTGIVTFHPAFADDRGFCRAALPCYPAVMNVPLTHAAEGLERRAFTVSDVIRMVEMGVLGRDERFELIGGEIVPMSPKGIRHERLKVWLLRRIMKALPDAIELAPETTFYLADDTFIEPDFVLYPAKAGLENLSAKTALLAIEIADSSLQYDLGRKAALYAEFGIGEMWVIDVNTMRATIHRDPEGGRYRAIEAHERGTPLRPQAIAGLSVNLGDYGYSVMRSNGIV